MFAGHNEAFLGPRFVFLQPCRDIQQPFSVDDGGVADNVVLTDVGEEIAVDDAQLVVMEFELERLIHVLHFVVVRMRLAVRSQ